MFNAGTKLVESTKNVCFEDGLRKLDLLSLKFKRIQDDLIEVQKIITDEDINSNCLFIFHKSSKTRRNMQKFYQKQVIHDLKNR